ncbi:MAG: TadE/TadG family type IV pilus assembly protein [Candidatus Sericytochromatia bacterium]|nr:TadE/TadG family type IV pilus assembly protein [Candidatus Sericytochromatia bacterium]
MTAVPRCQARTGGFRDDERGQALVEFALVLPMLVLLLLGVVYCGGLVLVQQSTAMAARHAARTVALDATLKGLKDGRGKGLQPDEQLARKAVSEAMPRSTVRVTGVAWSRLGASGRGMAGVYAKTGTLSLGAGLGQARCGVGVALYGATVTRDLSRDMTPLGRLAARMLPGGGLSNLLTPALSASALMPAELPIRGRDAQTPGLLDLNPWIAKVVSRPYKARRFE